MLSATANSILASEPEVKPEELPRTKAVEMGEALGTFEVRGGVRLELVAGESSAGASRHLAEVVDPIAMCFDEDARLFVVEMRDYSERRDERLGRIRMLEDTDEDGRFDKSTIFAEGLPWPTALIWYGGGLFVGSTPDILYFRDTNGDGKADERKVVFTGFGEGVKRLNVQQLFNSFTWGLDNRIHGASGGNGGKITTVGKSGSALELGASDFSFDPRTLEMRRENGGGQYGMTFDSAGRKFVCSNSAHIRQVMYAFGDVLPEMEYPLPAAALDIPVDGPSGPVYRISPEEPWRVLRTKWRVVGLVAGPIEGGGRASGYFTSASGVTIYRGTALGAEFEGDAFIADVGSNLVHRKKLRANGVPFKAERAADEQTSEFLASRDNWFRPVAFANGPDGALYIADMYREVIEHPWSLPPNIKKHIDLNSGNDRGRIYRAVGTNFVQPKLPRLSRSSNEELVAMLGHANGWHRDTASRLLFERLTKNADPSIAEKIREQIGSKEKYAGIYALNLLGSLEEASPGGAFKLEATDVGRAIQSTNAELVEVAVKFLPRFPNPAGVAVFDRLAKHSSARVRYAFAWALAKIDVLNKSALLSTLELRPGDFASGVVGELNWLHEVACAAASADKKLMSSKKREDFGWQFAVARSKSRNSKASSVAAIASVAASPRAEALKRYSAALELKGNAAKGKVIYQERCASCHRLYGQGTAVGPDLESVRTAGKELTLINILDPNREVPPRFATVEISTGDDELVTGVVANDAPNGISLRMANGAETFVPRSQIKGTRTTSTSLMPEGLEAGLTPADVADLLGYISGE
ncbi:MAG TPA: PVC-type heme-binding CxxCH protein [Verrucomicrobiae bacterium]